MLYRLIGLGLLAGVLGLGCGKTEQAKPAAEAAAPLEGHWLLSITQEYQPGDYRDVSTVLLAVKHEEGEYRAEIKGSKPALPRAKLKQFEVGENQVRVVLLCEGYTFDFVGILNDSIIRGTMDQGGFIIEPATLAKKPLRDISEAPDFDLPQNFLEHQKLLHDASDEESEAISLLDHYDAFLAFCEAHPKSPLSIILSHALVNVIPQKAKTEAEVKEFAKAYLKRAKIWGTRMQVLAQYNLGKSLARDARFADLGLRYLKEAEAQLDAAKQADVRQQLQYFRRLAEDSKARRKAEEAFARVKAGQPEALETLRKLNDISPFDPVLIYLRSEAARLTDQLAEAIRFNAQLAIWPRLQATLQAEPAWQAGEQKLPQDRLLELWVKHRSNEDGLEEYKTQIYEDALNLIAEQIGSPADSPAGNRVSVMELFTGTNCPPCLGADLATSALEKLYPQSHLVVLRYHVHTNGLDPLTNPRNMERFEHLLGPNPQGQVGTPSVFLNGVQAASGVGGYLDNAPAIGKSLQAELRPFLDETTLLNLKLSAYQHEDEISVSAKLTGVPEVQKDKLRVLLLLAESELDYEARNGIRRHEMLVRWYYQDGNSFALPSEGDFQYTTKTALQDIRELLETSTRSAASQMNAELTTIPLDLKGLRFVGLVQDAESREILQAAVVPVELLDTSPMRPTLPMPKLPEPEPATGPRLVLPNADPQPAEAEKP